MTRISKCHQLPKPTIIYTQRLFYWKLLIIVAVCLTPYVQSEHCEPANGKRQSPINIDDLTTKKVKGTTPIAFSQEYYKPLTYSLVNTGNKIQLNGLPENEMTVSGGPIKGSYKFRQLDIHLPGEHTFTNMSYAMEIQAVYEQTTNSSIDQYLIIGYHFQKKSFKNWGLTKIIKAIPTIANKDESTKIQNLKLNDVLKARLPTIRSSYFEYEGSLTTPPYTESVQWIMRRGYLSVSQNQLDVFYRAAMKTPGLVDNNRCVQDLNGRTVTEEVE